VADSWTRSTGFRFDFGDSGNRRTCDPTRPSDIRVSFAGSGYWSYVGTQAKLIDGQKQTLNLSNMDKGSGYTANDDGVILHEFGHAIGFEHEHQSPVSNCEEEFNWPYLYVALGMSKPEVERNMRRITAPSSKTALLTTPFDKDSIMLYSLSPAAFKNPTTAKCFIPNPNNALSTTDQTAARVVYPVTSANEPAAGLPSPAAAPSGPAASPPGTSASPAQVPGDTASAAITQSVKRLEDLLTSRP
jgi:hypothetical protein